VGNDTALGEVGGCAKTASQDQPDNTHAASTHCGTASPAGNATSARITKVAIGFSGTNPLHG